MFNPKAYENSRPDGIGVLEIVAGLKPTEGQPRLFVPLKRTELGGEVVGPLAALKLTQVYGYSRQQCDKVLEALYRFPLPGDAAVTGVRVTFGDVEIVAELKEREQAEAEYEEAKKQGKQAALATRESPDVFTLQVAGLQPDQEVTVETRYVQLARAQGDGWSLRVPLTTMPRYVRSDEVYSRHATGQPLLVLRDPGHRFSLDLTVRGAKSVQSSTHKLAVKKKARDVRVRLEEGEVIPDRDLVLAWRPKQEEARPTLQVLLHHDKPSGQVYFMALVAPPATHERGTGVPRDITLLVDHSGSMSGAKWEAADWAVESFLSDLTEQDAFALGLFHNTTRWFSSKLCQADAKEVEKAIRFLLESKDSGGTNLGVALEQALDINPSKGKRARHLLVVTDAQVTDAARVLRLATEESERKRRKRISVLCIDAAPNAFLANELAHRGGGVAKFLTSAPNEEDVTTALDEVLADWAEPVLADLRLSVNRAVVESGGGQVLQSDQAGWSSIDLGDLPSGRAIWVTGRVPKSDDEPLSFRLGTSDGQEVATFDADLSQKNKRLALKALFGARRVVGLEYLINSGYSGDTLRDQLRRLGYDPDEVLSGQVGKRPRVYAENVQLDAAIALKGLLVSEALDYGLASAETAFVAVRKEAGKPIEGTVPVASALAAGWSDDFVTSRLGAGTGVTLGLRKMVFRGGPTGAPPPMPVNVAFEMQTTAMPSFLRPPQKTKALVDFDKVAAKAKPEPLFSGVPEFDGGQAILFDSAREADAERLPESCTVKRLVMRFLKGAPGGKDLDRGLSILIYVGDLSSPRARVRIADLVRRRGERPLNISRQRGEVVRIVLVDPAGAWAGGAPQISVALGW